MTHMHQLHRAAARIEADSLDELARAQADMQTCIDCMKYREFADHGEVMDLLHDAMGIILRGIEDVPLEAMAEAADAYGDYRRDMDGDR